MSVGRRLSPAWLAAAFGLFALDIALHLPITDFFDSLAKRFGFFEYDAATQWVFLAIGVATLAALWWCTPQRRPVVRSGLIGVAAVVQHDRMDGGCREMRGCRLRARRKRRAGFQRAKAPL